MQIKYKDKKGQIHTHDGYALCYELTDCKVYYQEGDYDSDKIGRFLILNNGNVFDADIGKYLGFLLEGGTA